MQKIIAECLKQYCDSEIWCIVRKIKPKRPIGSYLTGYFVAGFQMEKTVKNQSGLGMQILPATIQWLVTFFNQQLEQIS